MNIKEATKHIKNTITVYLEKDEFGEFIIPLEKQRPLFLYGPPGIGKTAVIEQIADEMDIGIVSYSMTHHTRQSALGLPFIKTAVYDGKEFPISEFTMSEILASVYSYIEETGKKEGILFLDEINCVSETLAPSMLRFLQYKTFGSHPVPKGWVIVTAGNPPEFNKSVRDYDIATLDRIQKIDIESDYSVWREYAVNKNVHPAIIAYLDIRKVDFYCIENTPYGKTFVTARGWEDLSRIICSFEKNNIEIDATLIEQYIQNSTIATDFADFYNTFKKLDDLYCIEEISKGKFDDKIIKQLQEASVSEKLGFINLISNSITPILSNTVSDNTALKKAISIIKERDIGNASLENALNELALAIDELKTSDEISKDKKRVNRCVSKILSNFKEYLMLDNTDTKSAISGFFTKEIENIKASADFSETRLANVSEFIFRVFGESPELRIFVSTITANKSAAEFLIGFGCDRFNEISKSGFDSEKIIAQLNI